MKIASIAFMLLTVFSNYLTYSQGKKTTYYSINTVGLSFYENSVNDGSNFSISSIHGVCIKGLDTGDAPPIFAQGFWMGGGVVVDFLKAGTMIALMYEPRVKLGVIDLYGQLGYGFGVDALKGFAFGSGLGIPISINEKLAAQLELGYGGRGSKGFYFIRGGIRF